MTFNPDLKNSELIRADRKSLTSIQRQKQYVLRFFLVKHHCPACDHAQNLFECARVDIDAVDLVNGEPGDGPYPCLGCGKPLVWTLSLTGSQSWRIDHSAKVES